MTGWTVGPGVEDGAVEPGFRGDVRAGLIDGLDLAPHAEHVWLDGYQRSQIARVALIGYQSAMSNAGQGGAEPPARLLATARAAEAVLCLRDYGSAEGCADLLCASRLAGAPLSPAAAVA